MFKCELCDKEVKHTRNIIGAHMKMVHLISWKEYQEILLKLKAGINVGDLPAPEPEVVTPRLADSCRDLPTRHPELLTCVEIWPHQSQKW